MLRSKEPDVSSLEEEARQILSEGLGNAKCHTLREQTQSIKSDIASLLQLAEDQISRVHRASSSGRDLISEVRCAIDSLQRKELLIGRRPLPVEAECIDDEISHVVSLRGEVDALMMKVDEQKPSYMEVSQQLPPEIQQHVDELDNIKTRIVVSLLLHRDTYLVEQIV